MGLGELLIHYLNKTHLKSACCFASSATICPQHTSHAIWQLYLASLVLPNYVQVPAGGGQKFSPSQISGFILGKMRETAGETILPCIRQSLMALIGLTSCQLQGKLAGDSRQGSGLCAQSLTWGGLSPRPSSQCQARTKPMSQLFLPLIMTFACLAAVVRPVMAEVRVNRGKPVRVLCCMWPGIPRPELWAPQCAL